jgi:superfamily II DNA or RNA helicase
MTKLIVLDKMIGSMTEFKQIIGRGTRLREKEGKTHFTVMDFRRVSRLFADPDWDGPIEIVDGFDPERPPKEPKPSKGDEPPKPPAVKSSARRICRSRFSFCRLSSRWLRSAGFDSVRRTRSDIWLRMRRSMLSISGMR